MSHFTVLVVTESPEELDGALARFDEQDEKYLEFDDGHEEFLLDYEQYKEEGQTLEEYANDDGYAKEGERYGWMSNPDAKWDWWIIGGRWSGMLRVKDAANASRGEDGVGGSNYDKHGYDQCQVKNLDLDAMRIDARKSAEKTWTTYEAEVAKGDDSGKANKYWYSIKEDDTKESYVERNTHFSTFGLLMDDKWYGKGEMGWWACVSNENNNWDEEFTKLFESLDGEKWITVIDCHI